jgi:hypothetical protein
VNGNNEEPSLAKIDRGNSFSLMRRCGEYSNDE